MKSNWIFIIIYFLIAGCSSTTIVTAPEIQLNLNKIDSNTDSVGYIPWGYYELEIARDGSFAEVIPLRSTSAELRWGYHMNVVKFLEAGPCTNCLWLSNIKLLPNGDVSVDISLKHPFMDRRYTGFDVRGIIMFPATQKLPDLKIQEELDCLGVTPPGISFDRISNYHYGDAELMNPDGWTTAYQAEKESLIMDGQWVRDMWKPNQKTDAPIFYYYPGKLASGEDLSTISAFKRYHSTETRHMFEVGKTVTRTFIIRPPADGPIKAGYAVYAHWYPPDKVPVFDPAVDFPPRANSPLPYEFYITQSSPIDPDNPDLAKECEKIQWHIKMWSIEKEHWRVRAVSVERAGGDGGDILYNHPNGEPDVYFAEAGVGIHASCVKDGFPDNIPASWRIIFGFKVKDPSENFWSQNFIGKELYLFRPEFLPFDGEY